MATKKKITDYWSVGQNIWFFEGDKRDMYYGRISKVSLNKEEFTVKARLYRDEFNGMFPEEKEFIKKKEELKLRK